MLQQRNAVSISVVYADLLTPVNILHVHLQTGVKNISQFLLI